MSLPAVALDLPPICPDCARQLGLCGNDHCRRAVLPQPAVSPLIRLIGEARVEQTARQSKRHADPTQLARIARRNARRMAKSTRRGAYGLACHLAGIVHD